jgi:hypothetical protein
MSLHYVDSDGNLTNKYKRGKGIDNSILKKYKITQKMIANWFNYSSVNSFTGSKAKKDMINGIIEVIKQVEKISPTK